MSAENDPPLAETMRRIEDAFMEGSEERPRAQPSIDAIRAAEALLFAGGEPVTAKALGEKLGPAVDVAAVLMKLKADYAERGVQLVEAGGAWRFQSAPDLASLFAETREAPRNSPALRQTTQKVSLMISSAKS